MAKGLIAVRVLVADTVAVAVAAELSAARADAVVVADDVAVAVAVAVADDVAVAVADDVAVALGCAGPLTAGLNVYPAFTYAAVLPQQAASGSLCLTLR